MPRWCTATGCSPSALRDDLPAIDNSWGAYGAEDDAPRDDELVRQEAGAAADASGDKSLIEQAYAKWQGLDADERSPLGQAGVLRDDDRCHRRIAGAALRPRRPAPPPVGALADGRRDVVLARADHRSGRARLRLRGPHGVPAPQHAGRRRRHARRRARRPSARHCRRGRTRCSSSRPTTAPTSHRPTSGG